VTGHDERAAALRLAIEAGHNVGRPAVNDPDTDPVRAAHAAVDYARGADRHYTGGQR
jgi:hypothetical protein